ncbi:4-methyl-5(b-hydroxyethyl)-thiazole monophosphate biosynthesis [Babesia microti strain RI]|uniref:4-methyl-5(B-hydroxyethyl)-thiazole monophosphate biosynthesis n=1 Tax=Babesia microti (strain RI) TaxID=1133968 RepID=I7I9L1_BABMR|nr:4-methyl-5(b-hydroxyethyl)-thiazole monophosphate biosynthesis [Babesia microti strain RI]CCF75229.1 4-methyl-5(b-hydroxyethyl)-thiazole monophosphate biosynthesis [Babesia microti strain RI]|eukprot:XP_012649637.1 4-methyl-5(b-hydroxyethyl)-thiazole monophosphate biosynthesis [Babesia microti strain RI]
MRILPTFITLNLTKCLTYPQFNHLNKTNYIKSTNRLHTFAMSKTALIVAGNGSEDIEFVAVCDVLHRGGVQISTASVSGNKTITLSHGLKVILDDLVENVKEKSFDAIVVPGGLDGCVNCAQNLTLIEMLKKQKEDGRIYAAICAAPEMVLAAHGILDANTPAVGYPGCDTGIPNKGSGRVQVSGNCVTSISPGSAIEFALTLVELLSGPDKMKRVKSGLIPHPSS